MPRWFLLGLRRTARWKFLMKQQLDGSNLVPGLGRKRARQYLLATLTTPTHLGCSLIYAASRLATQSNSSMRRALNIGTR